MAGEIQIHQIAFPGPGVLDIAYTVFPDEVRGAVSMFRQVSLDLRHPDYREDATELMEMVKRMLANALEDWEEAPPGVADEPDDDDDDDRGMGMG